MKLTALVAIATLVVTLGAGQPDLPPALDAIVDPTVWDAGRLAKVNDYINSHPTDGNGYAVRCFVNIFWRPRGLTDVSEPPVPLDDCRKGVALSPRSPYAHFALAFALGQTSRAKASLAEYTAAIDLGMTDRGVFAARCGLEEGAGDINDADLDCTREAQLNPDPRAHYDLAYLHMRMGRSDQAIDDLSYVIAHRWDMAHAYLHRGLLYSAESEFAQADADLTQSISMCLNYGPLATAYLTRGNAREKLGESDLALADYKEVLATIWSAPEQRNIAMRAIARLEGPSPSPAPTPSTTPSAATGIECR